MWYWVLWVLVVFKSSDFSVMLNNKAKIMSLIPGWTWKLCCCFNVTFAITTQTVVWSSDWILVRMNHSKSVNTGVNISNHVLEFSFPLLDHYAWKYFYTQSLQGAQLEKKIPTSDVVKLSKIMYINPYHSTSISKCFKA